MPGVWQSRVREAVEDARRAWDSGIRAILLFGLPEYKDDIGSSSWDPAGPVQHAIEAIKRAVPEISVMADGCLREYTDHRHRRGVCDHRGTKGIDNHTTLARL